MDSGPDQPVTVIVSGLARSGTSMVAGILSALGLYMGTTSGMVIQEDGYFADVFTNFDYARMQHLIDARNHQYSRWGFKIPDLHHRMVPAQLRAFRNPRMILVTRDPVAVAVRNQMSGHDAHDELTTFLKCAESLADMVKFVDRAECGVLLLSYEKTIAFPDNAIESIAGFCGMTVTPANRQAARSFVEPNKSEYIEFFHPSYQGFFSGIRQGFAEGWCRHDTSDEPVALELLVDGRIAGTCLANLYSRDLERQDFGGGCHAFRMNVAGLSISDTASLAMRVKGVDFVLNQSSAIEVDPALPDHYHGFFDGIRSGHAVGWCQRIDGDAPVTLEVLVDDRIIGTCVADIYRQDLQAQGMGSGRHGFSLDLTNVAIRPYAQVKVRVKVAS